MPSSKPLLLGLLAITVLVVLGLSKTSLSLKRDEVVITGLVTNLTPVTGGILVSLDNGQQVLSKQPITLGTRVNIRVAKNNSYLTALEVTQDTSSIVGYRTFDNCYTNDGWLVTREGRIWSNNPDLENGYWTQITCGIKPDGKLVVLALNKGD